MLTLIHLSYSPWSERARWALDARGIEYTRRHYQPLLGEAEIRWRTRRWTEPVTVPVLLTDQGTVADSWEIARWADERGTRGERLFPEAALPEIEAWDERAQRGMAAGRMLSLRRIVERTDALDELTPKLMRSLGSVARAVTRAGVQRTLRKYASATSGDSQTVLVGVLDEVQKAIRNMTAPLLGDFTYADITAAQLLVFVQPPDPKYVRLAPANRELFGDAELAAKYGDVIAWRDEVYRRYRAN